MSEGQSDHSRAAVPGLAAALTRCLREADLVGWRRAGHVAGALLTEADPERGAERLIGTKVLRSLGAALPPEVGRGLRVRVYRYGRGGGKVGFRRVFAATGAGEATGPLTERADVEPHKAPKEASATSWRAEGILSRRAGI